MDVVDFWKGRRVVVAGGFGFVGSHVARHVASLGAKVIPCSRCAGCDLRDFDATLDFFRHHTPHVVINCAANQGGLAYQKLKPADLYRDNILINLNLMESAAQTRSVKKFVNIIAGCAYPGQMGHDAMREDMLFNRPVHPSVQTYGSVKRAALVQGMAYRDQYNLDAISLVLINLYGPGEHFTPDRSHALAALLRKVYEAKRDSLPAITIWGSGSPVREWLYVKDAAEGIALAAEKYSAKTPLNIATGQGISVLALTKIIKGIVGYEGRIEHDMDKPEGAPYKVANIAKMKRVLGWAPPTTLHAGITKTLDWLKENYEKATAE